MDWSVQFYCRFAAAVAALSLSCSICFAQAFTDPNLEPSTVIFDEVSSSERIHLERVKEFLAAKQWDEAVETLRRLMENNPQQVIPVRLSTNKAPIEFRRFITLQRYCQIQLTRWYWDAPEALAFYRRSVDPLASRWLSQAVQQRDEALLRRITEQLFASSHGDEALYLLGEIALERGEYSTARDYWERMSPMLRTPSEFSSAWQAAPGRALWLTLQGVDLEKKWEALEPGLKSSPGPTDRLVYPDTDINLGEVRARLALVSILESSPRRAALEIELLRRLHPNSRGNLAGSRGLYVDRLSSLLEQSQHWAQTQVKPLWPTFAGSSARNARIDSEIDIFGKSLWKESLRSDEAAEQEVVSSSAHLYKSAEARSFPLVVADPKSPDRLLAIYSVGSQIKALQLNNGKPAWLGGVAPGVIYNVKPLLNSSFYPRANLENDSSTAITVHQGKLFARMERLITNDTTNVSTVRMESFLIGLDLLAEGRLLPNFPLVLKDPALDFAGPPLCVEDRLFVALRRRDNIHTHAILACFNLQTGRQIWHRQICKSESQRSPPRQAANQLLTLHEGVVYYNTNIGATVAISASDGTIRWIVQYPRSIAIKQTSRSRQNEFRPPSPCLVHKGIVFSAPADRKRIFALDSATGYWVWATPVEVAADVRHLLGASQESLIASGDYLYWFDIYSGQRLGQFPGARRSASGFAKASPLGMGRGLLSKDHVYWPTREKIHVFRRKPAITDRGTRVVKIREIDLSVRGVSGGNLTLAGDVLLIATGKKLYAFRQSGNVD